MWVLTDEGRLVNLDQTFNVFYDEDRGAVVAHGACVATYQGYDSYTWDVLCSCDDAEHGKRIIEAIATYLDAPRERAGNVIKAADLKSMAAREQGGDES